MARRTRSSSFLRRQEPRPCMVPPWTRGTAPRRSCGGRDLAPVCGPHGVCGLDVGRSPRRSCEGRNLAPVCGPHGVCGLDAGHSPRRSCGGRNLAPWRGCPFSSLYGAPLDAGRSPRRSCEGRNLAPGVWPPSSLRRQESRPRYPRATRFLPPQERRAQRSSPNTARIDAPRLLSSLTRAPCAGRKNVAC